MTNYSLSRTRATDDRMGGARSIGLLNGAKKFRDSVGIKDKFDYYSFSIASRSSFNLKLDKLKNNVDVALIQNGQTVARSTRGGKKPESINTTLETGTYFIKVSQRSGNSRYRLSLDASPILTPVPTPTPTPTPVLGKFLSVRGGTPSVGRIDPNSGNFTPLPNSTSNFSDIAAFGNDLYGTTLFGSISKIDPNTGTETFLGTASAFELNALDFAPSGVLYGTARSGFYSINTANGSSQKIADIPGFYSSGDLAYDATTQRFLATSINSTGSSNSLYSIGLAGDARLIGDIGFNEVWGLFFDNGTLYGYTSDRQQIVINPTTGVGTFNKTVTGTSNAIGGAT
jgi:hypothetical protein